MTTLTMAAMAADCSRIAAVAANERSAGAGRIPGKQSGILVEICTCTYMYGRIGERRAWTTRLRVAAGVPAFSALLPMIRKILRIQVEA